MNDLLQSIGRGNEKKAIPFVKGVFKWDSKNKYIDLLALWMRLHKYIYFELWQFQNHRRRYWAEKPVLTWNLHQHVNRVCGTLQSHISSRLPQNTADLKIKSSTVLSFVLTCTEISDIGKVMPVLAGSTFSQVCGFQHRVCYVSVAQSILLPCDFPLKGSCI